MKQTSATIVFFGSGPVAAESLLLLAKNFSIEGVVTKPQPKHHKGDVPVLRHAKELGFPVVTVTNKKSLDVAFETKPFKSKVAVLIDFGILISQKVIDYFPLGIINSHFSLLPEWRGADPITFAILSGQKQTGVSLMRLVPAMDEGPLLGYGEFDVPPDTTAPALTTELIKLSDALLKTLLPKYIEGGLVLAPQDPTRTPTYSRKLVKGDSIIDWHKPAEQIEREIRAFVGWPKSHAKLGGIEVIVTAGHVVQRQTGEAGSIIIEGRQLLVACGSQALAIDKLKPAGKKEMTGEAFLAGYTHTLS